MDEATRTSAVITGGISGLYYIYHVIDNIKLLGFAIGGAIGAAIGGAASGVGYDMALSRYHGK